MVTGDFLRSERFNVRNTTSLSDQEFEVEVPTEGIYTVTVVGTMSCSNCCYANPDDPGNEDCGNSNQPGFGGEPRFRGQVFGIDASNTPGSSIFVELDFTRCSDCGCRD